MADRPSGKRGFPLLNLLLVVPFIATLWVSSYNSVAPTLWGIPFFYWYQFLWVLLGSLVIIVVLRFTNPDEEP